jgi:hypothetical protein
MAFIVGRRCTKTCRDGQVVDTGKLGDLADVAERGTHDDGVVAELLVVVVDGLDGGDTGVLLLGVVLLGRGLEPVEDAADEGGDEVGTGLGGTDGLGQGEEEGQVGVDAVVALEDLGGLDALPGGGDLDEDAVLGDALLLVELWRVSAQTVRGRGVPFTGLDARERSGGKRTSMMRRAFLTEAWVSKEKRASTSVETLPGTMARISLPNSTRRRSRAWSTWASMSPPCCLAQAMAVSVSLAYSGFLEAARIREGLVVASWGLYLAMAVAGISVSCFLRTVGRA